MATSAMATRSRQHDTATPAAHLYVVHSPRTSSGSTWGPQFSTSRATALLHQGIRVRERLHATRLRVQPSLNETTGLILDVGSTRHLVEALPVVSVSIQLHVDAVHVLAAFRFHHLDDARATVEVRSAGGGRLAAQEGLSFVRRQPAAELGGGRGGAQGAVAA